MNPRFNWDMLGIAASMACAIHCAILPLLLTSLPLFGMEVIDNNVFEIAMIVLSLIIGINALWHGYKKHHHSVIPILIFSAGIILLFAKQVWHQYQLWILPFAVILIVGGHLLNYRSCRIHNHAHADDCDH
ncbi:MAG TPA: MerC domain-containing protein [Flavitalea sp.]|nr:MerC domain-containing protein [Flavitalea sp.]